MKYCNLIGPLQVVYSTYYPKNTYYTHREHLLHPPRTLITPAANNITLPANTYYTCDKNNVLKVTGIQYRCGVTVKLFELY